jgi:hypothetical protein
MLVRSTIAALLALGLSGVSSSSSSAPTTDWEAGLSTVQNAFDPELRSSTQPVIILAKSKAQCEAEYRRCRATKPRGVRDEDNRERCLSHKYQCEES